MTHWKLQDCSLVELISNMWRSVPSEESRCKCSNFCALFLRENLYAGQAKLCNGISVDQNDPIKEAERPETFTQFLLFDVDFIFDVNFVI